MTQQLLRPLRQWPWLRHHRTFVPIPLHHHHRLLTPEPSKTTPTSHHHRFSLATLASSRRTPNVPLSTTTDSDLEARKSRNQLKREAKRAVKWGMDLASFSPPQIKRILRVASLDQVVFEALMLVKRLGPDVREGRRRQFSYIGKLLREVEPELMDRLIKATKDSDQKELQALTGLVSDDVEGDDDLVETEYEEDEEESNWHDNQVTRWFDGLINKDTEITNEVYSVQGVEFDRQSGAEPCTNLCVDGSQLFKNRTPEELRKLVRRVHFTQEMKVDNEEEEKKVETATVGAKKALTCYLRGLSKRIPSEY